MFCGLLVLQSGVLSDSTGNKPLTLLQRTTGSDAGAAGADPNSADANDEPAAMTADDSPQQVFTASGGPLEKVSLGSVDPDGSYMYRLLLTSTGAAIETATFSDFDDRDHKDPQPLDIMSPVLERNRKIMAMANRELVLVDLDRQFRFQDLSWKSLGKQTTADGVQSASFEAVINNSDGQGVFRITKTYVVSPATYMFDFDVKVDNLMDQPQKIRFDMAGPLGLEREAVRRDGRNVVAAFETPEGAVKSIRRDIKKLRKGDEDDVQLIFKEPGTFLWAAATNKYFAAIVVPTPDEGKGYADWLARRTGEYYEPGPGGGDETLGLEFKIADTVLKKVGDAGSERVYDFRVYLGPKDKSLFDENDLYRRLGFFQTIDFLACCCPGWLIKPLAFGILAAMKWMYGFIGNYGIVIIILVFCVRLAMHPITKKSQVSMSKFSKMAPRAEEIKKKYANNKAEMQKQLMALYRESGSSPIMGFLPMLIQMPIWIALYSAIYASIELRGAAFLPFWITDLSVPDALIRWDPVTLPLLGWQIESLNLLPILMGLAFYLQQKLMPNQAAASSNPQMAQQQKMMMVMMPLLFPLMLYKAPSGLNLYIMASTFAGVIEQHVIRKHIREKEQAEEKGLVAATSKTGGKVKKKKPKPFIKK